MPIRPLCWCYDRRGYCYCLRPQAPRRVCMRFYTYHRGDCGPCFNPARAAFHHAHFRSPSGVTGPFQWRIARGALCVLLCQYVLSTRAATSQLASPTSTCLCLRFIWLLPLGAKYSAVPRIVHVLTPNIKRAVPGYNWHNALPANAHPPHSHQRILTHQVLSPATTGTMRYLPTRILHTHTNTNSHTKCYPRLQLAQCATCQRASSTLTLTQTHTPSAIPGYNWHNALPANAHPPHSH
jgi:hypothetical protein